MPRFKVKIFAGIYLIYLSHHSFAGPGISGGNPINSTQIHINLRENVKFIPTEHFRVKVDDTGTTFYQNFQKSMNIYIKSTEYIPCQLSAIGESCLVLDSNNVVEGYKKIETNRFVKIKIALADRNVNRQLIFLKLSAAITN